MRDRLLLHQRNGRMLSRAEASSNASVRFIRAATGTGLGCDECNVVRALGTRMVKSTSETKDHPVLTGDSENEAKNGKRDMLNV